MIQSALTEFADMERSVERLGGDIPPELVGSFNQTLREFQISAIPLLEDQLS